MDLTEPQLRQKLEIMEMQLDDYKYKNENLKRMYDALQKAFEQDSSAVLQNRLEQEIRKLNENHTKDMQEQKNWHQNQIQLLDTKNAELLAKNKQIIEMYQQKESSFEKQIAMLRKQIQILESEKKELTSKSKNRYEE